LGVELAIDHFGVVGGVNEAEMKGCCVSNSMRKRWEIMKICTTGRRKLHVSVNVSGRIPENK